MTITRKQVPNNQRIQHTADLFGLNFPLHLEPFVYAITGSIADDYDGGYWEFYELSNGGFYMAPHSDTPFQVSCENGYEGELSGDALGITACLYAYSNLSFTGKSGFDETCARQYHWLRDYMLEHPEARAILGAID
jgi:hypothetical protein